LPHVPNYPDPQARQILNEGLVTTVEPIISSGAGRVFTDKDGWTVRTRTTRLQPIFKHTFGDNLRRVQLADRWLA